MIWIDEELANQDTIQPHTLLDQFGQIIWTDMPKKKDVDTSDPDPRYWGRIIRRDEID